MVFKKKIDNGQNCFRVPVIPKAPRSVRRRGHHKMVVEKARICAFELLASLAGKLLEETESSSASSNASEGSKQTAYSENVDRGEQNVCRPLKFECIDHGSCEESVYVSEHATQKTDQKCVKKESARDESDSNMECTSIVSSSDCSGKVHNNAKPVNLEAKIISGNFDCKLEGTCTINGEHCISNSNVDKGIGKTLDVHRKGSVNLTSGSQYSVKDKMVNMVDKLTLTRNTVPISRQSDISLGSRDDDEKYSGFSKYKAFRPAKWIGDRKMRRLLMSKYWKVAPKLKDYELALPSKRLVNEGRWKAVYHKRKSCYTHANSKHYGLHKRRKLFDQSSIDISDGGVSSESVTNSPEEDLIWEKNGLAVKYRGVNGVSSSVIGHQPSFISKTSTVKFSIKSFKVPELYIEVPESATVGSLKSTVMEAVTAFFGGGLHVGVLHEGEKVRDDNWTLSQAGITHKGNLDSLNFTLEPNPTKASPPDSTFQFFESPRPLKRSSTAPILISGISDTPSEIPAFANGSNYSASHHKVASQHADISNDKAVTCSRAIVPVPPLSVEALAVVPVSQKTKRSESAQRRTRRPFSVTEVEALVQAVEKLGIGRWRDVKLNAFEKADHRTYVDLKDKWKTLVHTANISPQQRRGEPVPQELLDRVLAAHAYWSQHQAKPQCKQQVGTPENPGRNGVRCITMA